MNKYQLVKYKGKWALYLKDACTYEFIGAGKKKILEAIKELQAGDKQ